MSSATASSHPIRLGPSLDNGASPQGGPSLVSVKYNFKPPSIAPSNPGFLYSPSHSNASWSLEYAMREDDEERADSRSAAQGFQGNQSAVKDVDCVLIWDVHTQCYVLDRLASSFSFKYDRGHTKLSDQARASLSDRASLPNATSPLPSTGALGLDLSTTEALTGDAMTIDAEQQQTTTSQHDKHQHVEASKAGDDDDDEAEFARQLELGLESFATDSDGKESSLDAEPAAMARAKTGLGLLEGSGLREDVMTPRGSPYIDRPKGQWGTSKSSLSQAKGLIGRKAIDSAALSTPVVSPSSVANSPRTGLDSTLSVSSTWKPPAQRSNVAIAYDEDEDDDDGDEESDDDEEDDDDDDVDDDNDDDDDDDLDAYARQLESSLQG